MADRFDKLRFGELDVRQIREFLSDGGRIVMERGNDEQVRRQVQLVDDAEIVPLKPSPRLLLGEIGFQPHGEPAGPHCELAILLEVDLRSCPRSIFPFGRGSGNDLLSRFLERQELREDFRWDEALDGVTLS